MATTVKNGHHKSISLKEETDCNFKDEGVSHDYSDEREGKEKKEKLYVLEIIKLLLMNSEHSSSKI